MTDDPPDADASAPATCTFTPDELDVPEVFRPDTGCSRPVREDAPRGDLEARVRALEDALDEDDGRN
jgi:hypothetical protein